MKAVLVLGVLTVAAGASLALAGRDETTKRIVGHGQIRYCARGLCGGPEKWARQSLRNAERARWAERREWLLTLTVERLRRVRRRLEVHQPESPPRQPSVWDRVAECESSGDWAYNGSSGFDGGLQFEPGTWAAYRQEEPAYAYQASREQQIAVAERVLADQGWAAWPVCSRNLGLR